MSILLINNTQEVDGVVYAVKAANKAGVAKCSGNLVVESK